VKRYTRPDFIRSGSKLYVRPKVEIVRPEPKKSKHRKRREKREKDNLA
jgi:hypothetical protein